MARPSLSAWTFDARMDPTIRVGIVLPEDQMDSLHIRIPDQGYTVSANGGRGQVLRSMAAKVIAEDDRVVLLSEAGVVGPAEIIHLTPIEKRPLQRGEGVHFRGVITGRGFHWQKRIHPTLCGTVEFRVWLGHLLVVNELPVEDYLPGVIAGEMSGDCPREFLKSQCLVARSWVLAHTEDKHPDLPIDRCNDDCCQRYHGTSDLTTGVLEAVQSTGGQVIVDYNARLVDTNYSKSCGGISESPWNVWTVFKPGQRAAVDAPPDSEAHRFFPLTEDKLPEYLSGDWLAKTDVFCSPNVVPERELPKYLSKVDEGGKYFRWRADYDRIDLENVLVRKFFSRRDPGHVAAMGTLGDLRVTARGKSGRATCLEVHYADPMGASRSVEIRGEYAIRHALHERFLYSSAFLLTIKRDDSGLPTRITLTGAGWGHGAGLCQIGALGMALKGHDCESIIRHYFEAIQIRQSY